MMSHSRRVTERRVKARYACIEPLLAPEMFPDLWAQNFYRTVRVVDERANQFEVSRSTVYNWLRRLNEYGLPGLCRKTRRDKGSKRLNMEFIWPQISTTEWVRG